MLSLQEAVQKDQVRTQLKQVKQCLDTGRFHPDIASIYKVESPALRVQLQETLNAIPIREFLAKSGTTGIAGAAYMVPDKIHDELVYKSRRTDIVPLIGAVVDGWAGGDLLIDIVSDHTYIPHRFSSGGRMPTSTIETTQATITPISFGIAPRITRDLIDDAIKSDFGLVAYHLEKAALAMGSFASDLALNVLKTATDGWGTLNSAASGDADETKFTGGTTTDLVLAVRKLGDDKYVPNTVVCTSEAWGNSIGVQAVPAGWTNMPAAEGYDFKVNILDFILSNSTELHASSDTEGAAMTNCITLIFDRNNALLTGRKRWMQISNYSDPVRDLAGATITARQDSVTLYNDSIYKITET